MISTPQDTPATAIDVLGNDAANGQTIDVATVVATDPPNGSTTVNATTGTITYVPMRATRAPTALLIPSKTSKAIFRMPAPVTVTVTDPRAPIAVADMISTLLDTPAADVDVLSNDTANGQTIDVTTVDATDPSNGTATVNATTGTITYVPDAGYIGPDSFVYTVQDTEGDTSNTTTVTVTITNPGAPLTVADVISTPQDTPATAIDVLSNDTANGQTIDVTTVVATDPPNGTTAVNATTGTITYTPDAGYIGPDSFVYTVQDTEGDTSNAGPRHGHGYR